MATTDLQVLLGFVKQHFEGLLQIYMQENKTNSLGALKIWAENNEAKVGFFPHDQLDASWQAIIVAVETAKMEGTDALKVENKWMISMPPVDPRRFTDELEAVYFVIADHFFCGFPQMSKIGGRDICQYVLVSDPPESESESGAGTWTVGRTETGKAFLDFCKKAATDDTNTVFATFKTAPEYTQIVVAGEEWHGDSYLERIMPGFLEPGGPGRELIAAADAVGSAQTYYYPLHDLTASPQTLRHFYTVSTILKNFGRDIDTVLEFGAGHGGLAHIWGELVGGSKYTVIELPQVLALTQRYLGATLGNSEAVEYVEAEDWEQVILGSEYDLLISEYAICELSAEALDETFAIFKRARRAYLTMNLWDPERKEAFINRLREIYPRVVELPAYPETEWANYVLICGQE